MRIVQLQKKRPNRIGVFIADLRNIFRLPPKRRICRCRHGKEIFTNGFHPRPEICQL